LRGAAVAGFAEAVEDWCARRRCNACKTISPAMIALVVAMAGMMFPAISVEYGDDDVSVIMHS
jgi:hypothetical protein